MLTAGSRLRTRTQARRAGLVPLLAGALMLAVGGSVAGAAKQTVKDPRDVPPSGQAAEDVRSVQVREKRRKLVFTIRLFGSTSVRPPSRRL